jgi:16S rRNA G966 N2-methylase RsmD
MNASAGIALKYANPAIDRSLDRDALDLTSRSRTSLFPWRGQFSPELVEHFLREIRPDGIVIDPFAGSGTTLFEAGRLGINAIGVEINPAALSFAVLSEMASKSTSLRIKAAREVTMALNRRQPKARIGGLFWDPSDSKIDELGIAKSILCDLADNSDATDILRAALILAMGQKSTIDLSVLSKEVERVRRLMEGLPETVGERRAIAADARRLPLADGEVVAAITSPPYINVFNYHQQYRPAVEFLGVGPLIVARSEIGANRKHRQNRFLTVVQYALDMAEALTELRRVLTLDGVAKVVVGRESNVRGLAFKNGQLIAALADGTGTFVVERWQERRFTSRFGRCIFEDVLTLRRTTKLTPVNGFTPLEAGISALEQARGQVQRADVEADLESAIEMAHTVLPSPLFEDVSIPWMRTRASSQKVPSRF